MDKSRKILPVGISDFRKIIEEQYYFVDKSLLIKEIINSGAEVTLLTRPRRFGKTLNMNMIKLFFEKSEEETASLFQGLKIWHCEEVNGEKMDMTTEEANITNSTSVMMSSVAQDEYSIGYISLGSLNNTVKALKIDGTEATAENIKAGTYKISRPFNIAAKEGLSEAGQDFINFILSKEGQAVVADNNYIPLDSAEAYASNGASGKVVIAGSSSVSPVMEKLKEAYAEMNSNVEIEIQTSDSTTGMQNAIDGVCDIGMASRELKDSELDAGLTPTVIALDGIAVIVNNSNPTDEMTSDQVKSIFTGDALAWDEAL